MLKKHILLTGILTSVILLLIAISVYPGGSNHDAHAKGFYWQYNYISNLFAPKAVNGQYNTSRIWAVSSWLLMTASIAAFFISFSRRIPRRSAANIIKYCGSAAMLLIFLAATPLHDAIIPLASTLSLVSIFYITVFLFKSRLHLLKVISVLCMLAAYTVLYFYFTRSFPELLPAAQKISLLLLIIFVISVHYTARSEHFQQSQPETPTRHS